jgi:hypothetical protein
MPEGTRVAARETVGTIEKTPAARGTPKAHPQPRTLQAQLLHQQRTIGNQAVQRLIRSGLPQPKTKSKPLTEREITQAEERPEQRDHNETAAEPSSVPPAGPATRISPLTRQRANAPHIQTAWYNFHIPFTDYEFDPSLEGLKTAGNLAAEKAKEGATWVKDKVVAAAEWVFEKIKGLISTGIDWLTGKFNEIKEFAVSSFADIKGALSGALGAITSPLGAITNAIGAMDAGILAAAWRALSAGANAAWQTAKGVINGVLKVGGGIWETVSGYVDSLFSAVDNMLDSTAFGLLPGVIQDGARSLYKTVHNLWTSIRDFWADFWNRLTSFVKDLLGSIEAFVQKVVSYAIDKVVETVKKLKEVYDFVKRLVTDPESVIRPIIAIIAGKIQAEAPGKAREVAQQKMTEALASSQSSQSSGTVVHIHRSPDGSSAKRSTATRAEVNEGVNRALADQWAALDIPKMLWDTVVNMFWPPATIRAIGHEFYELWNTDWKNAADSLFTPRNMFDDFGGFWHDVWSNFLVLLDFPLALWRRLNSILMLLMGYVSIILILVGLVGGAIVGNVPGALAGAAAGAQLAFALGEALFLSFLLAESASALKAFIDLYTARQTEQEKARDYLQFAASTIGIGVAIVIALLFALLGALVRDIVGRIKSGANAPPQVDPNAPPQVDPNAPPQVDPNAPPQVDPNAPPRPMPGAYDPTIRTDAQLQMDLDPAQRAGETPDEAQARVRAAEEEILQRWQRTYDALGEQPRRVNVRENDNANRGNGAHTIERHGPEIPLRRTDAPAGNRTLEGRIYGDPPWPQRANWSYKWLDESVMNRAVNEHIRANWDLIRQSLAVDGTYEATFDTGNAVGEGFFNENIARPQPPNAVYHQTSNVTLTLRLIPGNPPTFFIVRAFPAGAGL